MRIAFVSTILNHVWGGADVLWTQAAEQAQAQGHEVLLGVSDVVLEAPRIKKLLEHGAQATIHSAPIQGGKLRGVRELARRARGQKSTAEALQAWRPDRLILSQGGMFDYLAEAEILDAAESAGIPCEILCQCNDWSFCAPPSQFDEARRRALAARRFWFVSRHNLAVAESQLAMRLPNARIIQNPMECDLTPPAWPPDVPARFATVSRLHHLSKGLDLLFHALRHALSEKPGWTLTLFGRGDDEPYLRELAAHLQLEDRIAFAGFAPDIRKIWESHQIMLLPSRWEGCSLAMLEALASGRPVLAANVGGVSDWITDGENGFVCPAPEAGLLAKTLARAWEQRGEWQGMGEKSRQRYQSQHDPLPGRTLIEDFSS